MDYQRLEEIERAVLDRAATPEDWVELVRTCERHEGFEVDYLDPDRDAGGLVAAWRSAPTERGIGELLLPMLGVFVPPSNHFGIGPLTDWWKQSGRAEPEEHLHYDRETGLPLQLTRERDGSRMVLVPGGSFPLGEGETAREVELEPFYMDAHTRVIYSFQDFLEESGREPYSGHGEAWADGDTAAYGVRWEDALAYAERYRVEIPSEDEWEAAARGFDGRTYPWGEEPPDPGRAVYWTEAESFEETHEKYGSTAANFVRSILERNAGRSPFGLHDMAGNVAEWCRPTLPVPEDQGPTDRVLRGGCWLFPDLETLRCATRVFADGSPRLAGTSGVRYVMHLPR